MIQFDLAQYQKVRYWPDALPEVNATPLGTVTRRFDIATAPLSCRTVSMAYEVYLPAGARIRYGLLGARLTTLMSMSGLCITIPYVDQTQQRPYADALVPSTDGVYAGLAEEFVKGVVDGIDNSISVLPGLGGNLLEFACAAYSEVGSSIHIFRMLTHMLIDSLVRAPHVPFDESAVAELLKKYW